MLGSLLVEPPLCRSGLIVSSHSRIGIVDDELVDDDAVQKRRLVHEAGPVVDMFLGGFGLGLIPDRGDEPLPLAVPVVDDRRLGSLMLGGTISVVTFGRMSFLRNSRSYLP